MYEYNENTYISLIILTIILSILTIIANWKLYKKAGKPGWASLVPIYNYVVLLQIAGLNWWYFLISIGSSILTATEAESLLWLASIASYFVSFLIYYNIAKKTNQNKILYGILGMFVPYIAVLILGFSKKIAFDNNIKVNSNGIIGEKTNKSNQAQQPERFCLGCGQKLEGNETFCGNCGKKVE